MRRWKTFRRSSCGRHERKVKGGRPTDRARARAAGRRASDIRAAVAASRRRCHDPCLAIQSVPSCEASHAERVGRGATSCPSPSQTNSPTYSPFEAGPMRPPCKMHTKHTMRTFSAALSPPRDAQSPMGRDRRRRGRRRRRRGRQRSRCRLQSTEKRERKEGREGRKAE